MHTLFNKLVKSPQLFSQKEEDKKKSGTFKSEIIAGTWWQWE